MTQAQFKKRWSRLSFWRKEWVRAKANAGRMSLWAVLNEWTPPPTRECERMLRP